MVLLLWIICVFCAWCFSCFRVCSLLPCGHLLGKGWPLGSCWWCLLYFCYFPMWYRGSDVVLDCIIYDLCRLSYFKLWPRHLRRFKPKALSVEPSGASDIKIKHKNSYTLLAQYWLLPGNSQKGPWVVFCKSRCHFNIHVYFILLWMPYK